MIRDQHSFLTGNGLLLQEERQTDVRNMTTKLRSEWVYEKARLHHEIIEMAVSPPMHNSLLNNISWKRFVDVYVYTHIQVCISLLIPCFLQQQESGTACQIQRNYGNRSKERGTP